MLVCYILSYSQLKIRRRENILSSVHLMIIDLAEMILAASCNWLCIVMIVGNGVMGVLLPELYHVYCKISLYIAYRIPSAPL